MSRAYVIRGWLAAFWTWLLEPTEDAVSKAEKERKARALQDANNVLKFGGRRRG